MPSRKNFKLCKQRKTGKRNTKLSGGGHGASKPSRGPSIKRTSSVSSTASFVNIPTTNESSSKPNNLPVDQATQKLMDDSKKLEDRIDEILNSERESIKNMEAELKQLADYKNTIDSMLIDYNNGTYKPEKGTNEENLKNINDAIRQTNRYYTENKKILTERIQEARKDLEKVTAEKAVIDAKIRDKKLT